VSGASRGDVVHPRAEQIHLRYKKGPREVHRTSCNGRLRLPAPPALPRPLARTARRTQTLTRRLRQHGIEPRQARNSALAAWASDLPPAVLASLLGAHIQTAVNWASRIRRDRTSYIAERGSTPAPGNTARSE
jgi:hypothetical protein